MVNKLIADERTLLEDSLKQIEFPAVLEFVAKYCYSSLGKELILNCTPTDETYWLVKEHNLIDEMTNVMTQDDTLPFEGISDIKPYLHKSLVQNNILSTNEILYVKDLCRGSRLLKNYFKLKNEKYPNLYEETSFLYENRILEKHIDETIDDTANVRDNASRELLRIRRDIIEKSARLRSRMQKILKRVTEESMTQEDFISMREGRFVLPIKVENKRQIPGIIHGVSQTGSTVFLEPSEIIDMNNDLSLLVNEEKREIYKILQNLTAEIGDEANVILQSVHILAHFDSILAKARYALEFGGIKPEITTENEIYLNNIRHPQLVHSKGRKKVMPLSITFDSQKRGHLISGPNAGGKTVALKSIGLNIAMALSGIFPMGECRTNYRTIYAAIGDNQSIENDLSTFSSSILQLKHIVDHCSNQSLILVDEIGSGTDPQEGSALAAGLLDSFLEIKLFFVVTTHQSSLKSFALTRDEIDNASLEFDEKKLQPTYKFLQGIPGNSYAFVLAENIGISKHIIERAKKYLGSRHAELEESIRVLQQYRGEAEELRNKNAQERLQSEKIKKEYEAKYAEIKTKRSQLIKEARDEASEILTKANSLIENTVREIREDKRAANEIKNDFNREKQSLTEAPKPEKKAKDKSGTAFEIGDTVRTVESENIGTLLAYDMNNSTALIDFNGVKFRLPFEQIEKIATPKEKKSKTSIADNIKFDSKMSIDLRGKRAAESIREVDEFLSNAVLGNIPYFTIIHGKGTGALRQAIQEFLKDHPSIVSYRNGTLVEGGDGVTVVEL